MTKISKTLLMLLIFIGCTGFDRASKSTAQALLSDSPPLSYLGGMVQFHYIENSGAMLGIGASLPQHIRTGILIIFNALLLLYLLVYAWRSSEMTPLGMTAAMLIVAGGMSNIIDRLVNNGRVVDFIHIGIGRLRTGIFNFADFAILCGIGLLLLWSLTSHKVQPIQKE